MDCLVKELLENCPESSRTVDDDDGSNYDGWNAGHDGALRMLARSSWFWIDLLER